MRKGFVLIVFWQAMLSVSPVFADKVPELYQAAVGVIDQQSGSRANAIQKAFKQVLIRASGTTVIQSALLKPAQEYVEQYRYQVNPSLPEEKQLWVKFDALMVKQYLQDNGLQQWSDLRPSTLIWLAVDEDGQRSLVNQGLYTDVLVQSGTERGLPFLFPIMDLEDQTKVLFADVWGDFEETVKQGSVRYDADAVVVVRAQKQAGSWVTRWTLYYSGLPLHWELSGESLPDLLVKGSDKSVNEIANKSLAEQQVEQVANASSSTTIGPQLLILDVNTLSDYSRVMTYLQSLTHIEVVYPSEIGRSSVTLKIGSNVGLERVYAEIESGSVLSLSHTDQGVQFSLNP